MKILSTLLVLLVSFAFSPIIVGQLKCKKVTNKEGTVTTTCFHKNGNPSYIEIWGASKREGTMNCYNASGKQILSHLLRRFAGHASVYLDYYENGQIKKAEYSSAPDGGIQFWRIIYYFDETGNETGRTDMSEPDGHPVLRTMPDREDKEPPSKPIVQPIFSPQACAVPFSTVCQITNKTNKPLKIWMKAKPNFFIQLKDSIEIIQPGKTWKVKPIVLSQMFLKVNETFEPVIISKPSKRQRVVYKIITTEAEQQLQKKIYNWYVVALPITKNFK